VIGSGSSGRTAFGLSVLASASRRGEVVAWLDPADSLDPRGVCETGVCLERFLWVRPREDVLKQTLKAADLVLDAGGFAALVIDLAGVRTRAQVLRPAWWLRLARRAEAARTAVMTLAPWAVAGSAVCLRLACRRRGHTLTVDIVRRRGAAPVGRVHTTLGPPVD
jgi:RecA/RadA recombinase